MNKKYVLIFTAIFTIVGIFLVIFDWDRTLMLHFNSLDKLADVYRVKPKTGKRIVAVFELKDGEEISPLTLKSLVDQNVRLHDIAVQTNTPSNDEHLRKLVSFHKPQTEWLREPERDTVVLYIENGKEYPFGYIEDIDL